MIHSTFSYVVKRKRRDSIFFGKIFQALEKYPMVYSIPLSSKYFFDKFTQYVFILPFGSSL